ncbi:class II glutamine amidotransferase [Nocardia sp. NPDC052278]|uniref:class II glutamine amidotransferase n=1 Tax=unclassified Nocardia TaxID=2637762 RepID=UPI0036919055
MCILTFVKPGIAPNLDALRGGAAANPHGHGYAIITADTITVGRSMDADAAITEFAAIRKQYPEGPALFHSRLATHGVLSLDNCHPFVVGGDARTVLAHNGILPKIVHPAPDDPRSDTRIAAEEYLPVRPFGSLDSWAGRERLERWLGTDKMVLLTIDPAYQRAAYIFNEHHGHWDQGSWHSNHSYLDGLWSGEAEGYWGYCEECGEFNDDPVGPHCRICGFCADCLYSFPKCACPSLAGENRYADLFDLETT